MQSQQQPAKETARPFSYRQEYKASRFALCKTCPGRHNHNSNCGTCAVWLKS